MANGFRKPSPRRSRTHRLGDACGYMPLATMIDRHRGGTASMAMRFFGPLLKEATVLRRGMVGRRGPGLLGTVARTAVVAGTATAVSYTHLTLPTSDLV